MLYEIAYRLALTLIKAMFLRQNIPADNLLTTLFDLDHLGFQAGNEVVEPASHIHSIFTHTLDRSIKGRTVAIIIFADGEQSLEVIPSLVEAECREQTRDAAITVEKRVNMNKLKLGNATYQHGMDFQPTVQPFITISDIMIGTSTADGGVYITSPVDAFAT